jgi:hypothetical protein
MIKNNIEEIMQYFDPYRENLVLDWNDGEDLYDQRKRHGFKRKELTPRCFNTNKDNYEITVYLREEDKISVCELWNQDCCMFCFYTNTEEQTFKLIREYMKFLRDMTVIEKNLHYLCGDKI